MFEKGDVYTIEGANSAVRWVGVVTERHLSGSVKAIEIAYSKLLGMFISVNADVYFHVDRPGQRVLLTNPMKAAITEAKRVLP